MSGGPDPTEHGALQRTAFDPLGQTHPGAGEGGSSPDSPTSDVRAPHLGRYAVLGQLGAGGMGEVLEVRDGDLGRDVAVKVVRAAHVTPDQLARFVEEARITGQLEHPCIPPVHELGATPDGRPYFTMKRVVGQDLARILRELASGECPDLGRERGAAAGPAQLLAIFLKICDAVAFAHARGVIHRDLKPANVMVGEFGEVLVMDWGLARRAGRDGVDEGEVVGTPSYMAPEQARGESSRTDQRADVYALGAILYEILTLAPPYSGPSVELVLAAVGEGLLVSPSRRAPDRDVPWELEAVVLRAMARDPDARYPSASALRDDVLAYLDGRLVGAARYGLLRAAAKWIARHRHVAWGTAVAVLVAVVALGATRLQRQREVATLLDLAASQAPVAALETLNRALGVSAGDARVLAARDALLEGVAQRRLAALPDPARLGERCRERIRALRQGEGERLEPAEEQAERERIVSGFSEVVAWLDVGRAQSTADGHRPLRVRAGEGLAWSALLGGDYTLAHQAFVALAAHGVGDDEVRAWTDTVRTVREARLAVWLRRVDQAVDDVREGLDRDRAPGAPRLDDWLVELAGYRHPDVAAALGAALDRLAALASPEGQSRVWSQPERDLAVLLSTALGRLQLPESVPPLARWAAACGDPALAVEAGLALCNSRRQEALLPLLAVREQWGVNSVVWQQVRRDLARIPDAGRVATGTNDPGAWLRAAMVRADAGDLAGALAAYDEGLRLDPRDAGGYNGRGLVRMALGRFDDARADFDRAIELDPKRVSALDNRGVVRLERGDAAGALADFDRAIGLDPGRGASYGNRGNAYRALGDIERAMVDYGEAIRREPGRAAPYAMRGVVRGERGDVDGALADLGEAIRLDPRDAKVRVNRGNVLLVRGDLARAIADYDGAIRVEPTLSRPYAYRGAAKHALGDLPGARADLDHAIRLDPREATYYYNRANLRRDAGDAQGALEDFDRAIDLDPRAAAPYYNRGLLRHAAGELAMALGDYDRAFERGYRTAAAYDNRGVAREAREDYDGAAQDYDVAIELDSSYARAWGNRGHLRLRRGDAAGARADLDVAIRLDPRDVVYHVIRGNARRLLDDATGALADFDQAIELDARSWRAWAYRGRVLAHQGRRDEARDSLRRAHELAPVSARASLAAELAELR